MRNESGKKNLVLVDESAVSGFTRWLPTIIVFCVVGGFFTLSWYAYHAGIESVKDEDLLVVEADKTPMKEKPADPGGMQFPNQDKTIFDTFSSASKSPAQNVERILPSPEEPINKDMDTSETSTWINNKLSNGKTEQVIGQKVDAKIDRKKETKTEKAAAEHEVIPVSTPDDVSETFVATRSAVIETKSPTAQKAKVDADLAALKAAKDAEAKAAADKERAAKEQAAKDKLEAEKASKEAKEKAEAEKVAAEKEKAEAEKAAAREAKEKEAAAAKEAKEKAEAEKAAAKEAREKEAAAKAKDKPISTSSGNAAIQLGAYRSENEANQAWEKMHLKHKDLSDKEPTIVRADLGSKGMYYRLRVTGLDNAGAKSLCQSLTSRGQPCIQPTGK